MPSKAVTVKSVHKTSHDRQLALFFLHLNSTLLLFRNYTLFLLFDFTKMFAKQPVILAAAGLLSSTFAQNTTVQTNVTVNDTLYSNVTVNAVATVTLDVYAATTTVLSQCSVCTPGTNGSAYTVVVSNGVTTTLGSGPAATVGAGDAAQSTDAPTASIADAQQESNTAAGPAASGDASGAAVNAASDCGFTLAVNGTTTLQQISDGQIQAHEAPAGVGQISDGQIQAGSGLVSSSFTIANGMVYDQAGRICSISGQNQSQFQCNYVPTDGSTTTTFSLDGMNLAFNGNTQFYACLLGAAGEGYNIYQTLTGNQHTCSPITLAAIGSTACAPATPAEPVTPATTIQASVVPATLTADATTPAATVVFTGAGSVSRSSVVGFVGAALFAFFMV